MNEVMVYSNGEFGEIRTVVIDGEPWFVGKDVAMALGYEQPHKAVARHCPHGMKHTIGVQTGLKADGSPAVQTIDVLMISEGDLYRLITKSQLPSAEKFSDWVFDEVLPSIRKTGTYSMQQKQDSYLIDDPIERAERWIEEYKERQRLEATIAEQKPLVDFATHVSDCRQAVDMAQMAKIAQDEHINIGTNTLFAWLREQKILMSSGTSWNLPYQEYLDRGYFRVQEKTFNDLGQGCWRMYTKTLVTGKGQVWLVNKLKKEYVRPYMGKQGAWIQPPNSV